MVRLSQKRLILSVLLCCEALQKRVEDGYQVKRTGEIKKNNPNLLLTLSVIALVMFMAMTVYELLKQSLFPAITLWQSHAITIVFSTLIATISGYFIFRRQVRLTNLLITKNAESEILQQKLESNIEQLNKLLAEVKTLSGMLPICASCKKIRDDKGYWNQIESYLKEHSDMVFSHGICPDCVRKLYPEIVQKESSSSSEERNV